MRRMSVPTSKSLEPRGFGRAEETEERERENERGGEDEVWGQGRGVRVTPYDYPLVVSNRSFTLIGSCLVLAHQAPSPAQAQH